MAIEKFITMNQKELLRLQVMEKLKAGRLTQKEAGKILGITIRQVRRLLKKYLIHGEYGLISKRRGKESNNKIGDKIKESVLQITKEKYNDFGPTFLREKLIENYGITISKETLRKWLIGEDMLKVRRRKKARVHQMRERRSSFGELVQIDGSPHDWFEGRGEKCCLLVFVDDATSKLVNLRFEEKETTAGYFRAMIEYITKFGLPAALYSDRHNIFRVNIPEPQNEGVTQFEQAMKELGIEIICANSPQAKGRVERANGVLQDRLVKEMRLRGISDIKTANVYLPSFTESYNKKFAVEPKNNVDAHVQLIGGKDLSLIFSFKHIRIASKNLELLYKNKIYQIEATGKGYGLHHAKITVCEDLNEKITLVYKGRKLNYHCYEKQQKTAEIVESKALNSKIDIIVKKTRKPDINHPWRTKGEPGFSHKNVSPAVDYFERGSAP
jgi:transposase